MSSEHRAESFGAALCAAVFITGLLSALDVFGATATHSIEVQNATPVVSGVSLNQGSAITLTPNTSTTVNVNFTVSDNNGCESVFSSGTLRIYVYRSGVGSSTASSSSSTLHSYWGSIATTSCVVGNASGAATATVGIWYFAQATDASSSFPSQTWLATVFAADASSSSSSVDSTGIELNTLLAIEAASSTLSYGTVAAGATTTGNFPATIVNAGNSSTTLTVFGTALTSGSNVIPTSSQHYATSTFSYGGAEQFLSGSASGISGLTISRPPFTSWATSTPLPQALNEMHTAALPGYLYSAAGSAISNTGTSTVLFAPLSATGSIGTWATTTPLPTSTRLGRGIGVNGYVYSAGGILDFGANTSTVLVSRANSDGSLGSWATTSPLNMSLINFGLTRNGNYLYVVGGNNGGGATASTSFALINATGSLSAWTSTSPLPTAIHHLGAAAYNGYIYAAGGFTPATTTVYYAPLNATGSIGTWATTTPLPVPLMRPYMVMSEGLLFVMLGVTNSGETTTTWYAPTKSDGTLGPWSEGAATAVATTDTPPISENGRVYVLGGRTARTSSTQVTPLNLRNTYWGLQVPGGMPTGTYTGITTVTAVFAP